MTGITGTDLFCGAGGSSTGLVFAGVEVKMAANHWKLAIETHTKNHPNTEHDCADLREAHPANYPSTDILWASPECTNHSLAKGKKRKNLGQLDLWGEKRIDPAEERSRATMREVVEFAEYHRYKIIIVENVVDIRNWMHYDAWLQAMHDLGYEHKALYLNAQFFGVPQSRDRVYVVFWRRGMKAPNLDFRIPADCPTCGEVEAYQWFKKSPEWGRYGGNRQYIYRCPKCLNAVHPRHTPAALAIDWGLPVTRIADRAKPLQPKTIQRIEAGLKKLAGKPFAVSMSHTHAEHRNKVSGLDTPLPTQTTKKDQGMVMPPLFLNMKGPNVAEPVSKALGAITTVDSHSLIAPAWLLTLRENNQALTLDKPMGTVTTWGNQGLIYPWMLTLRQSSQHRPIDDPLTTVTAGGNNHALIYSYYGTQGDLIPTDQPMPTVMGKDKHALLQQMPVVEECGFRMLKPHELRRAMGFPDDYIILGNDGDKVRQIGNAVCCPVAAAIGLRCVEALMMS